MTSRWWKVIVRMEEPFSCAPQPAVGNEIETTEHLPATTFRGALSAALSRSGRADQNSAWFGLDGPYYSDGWPSMSASPLIPMPLCFVRDKYDDGDFDGSFGAYNTLTRPGSSLPKENAGHRHQWTRMGRRWLAVNSSGEIQEAIDLEIETSMHVGLHYARQTVRGPALFSRAKLEKGAEFVLWIHDPNGVISDPPNKIFVGKRRSAGNGAAALSWQPDSEWPWTHQRETTHGGMQECLIQLLSPAILPSATTGAYQRGLTTAEIRPLFGDEAEIGVVSSAVATVGGWSSKWGLPRERAVTVSPGSAWLVRNASRKPTDALAFIGIRNCEGFGWVAIDPPWLYQGGEAGIYTDATQKTQPIFEEPQRWPGIDLPIDVMLALKEVCMNMLDSFQPHRSRIAFLAMVANRSETYSDWNQKLETCAASRNGDDWNRLKKQLDSLDHRQDLKRVRFLLDVLVGLTDKQRQ